MIVSCCVFVQELSLVDPEENVALEKGSDNPGNVSESSVHSTNPASPQCPSPSRHLQHLHSSVLITFDESDVECDEDQRTDPEPVNFPSQAEQNVPNATNNDATAASLPAGRPRNTQAKCMSRQDTLKSGASMGKGGSLQEVKPGTGRVRAAHFANMSDNAGEDSKTSREDMLRLPKLETSKQRAASIGGGGLSGGGGGTRGAAASSTSGPGDASRPTHTQLLNARRPRLSTSSPGNINGEPSDTVQSH